MTVQVKRRDGESAERLLKRFAGHIKSIKLLQKFRKKRYFAQKPTQVKQRVSAISRERYRKINRKRQFLG